MWVSNGNLIGAAVTKVRASDGKVLGTFPLPGVVPWWMTFDGANIWIPTSNSNPSSNGSVTKLRASDGKNLGSFTVGISPEAAAFDGQNVWVANTGSNDVTKLRAADGMPLVDLCDWRRASRDLLRRGEYLGGKPARQYCFQAAFQ